MTRNNSRIAWLDMAKVLTMFFVIFDHLGVKNQDVSHWVWTFHLPTFFLISGVFYKQHISLAEQMKKDFFRLLLPVMIWWGIGILTWQPFFIAYFNRQEFSTYYISEITNFCSGYNMSFGWFMIALFWMKLELNLLDRFNPWCGGGIALVGMPLIAWVLKSNMDSLLPFYLTNSFAAFPFFYIGHLFGDKIKSLNYNKAFAAGVFFLCLIASVILFPVCGLVSLNAVEFGNYMIVMYITGIIGCSMILFFSYTLSRYGKYKIINILGGGAVVLLLFQPPFLYLFKIIYKWMFHIDIRGAYFDSISAIIATTLIMLIMYPCIVWINENTPILNGIIKHK